MSRTAYLILGRECGISGIPVFMNSCNTPDAVHPSAGALGTQPGYRWTAASKADTGTPRPSATRLMSRRLGFCDPRSMLPM